MVRQLRDLLYHPIRGRLLYDLTVTMITYALIEWVIWSLGKEEFHVYEWLIFSGLIVSFNFVTGIYTRHRTSTALKKAQYILISVLGTVILMSFLLIPYWQLVVSAVFAFMLLIMPRWFLNINRDRLLPTHAFQFLNTGDPILVVGGAGYIGSHVVGQLLSQKHRVRVLDTFYYGDGGLANFKSTNLEIVKGDITDLFQLTRAFANVKGVVHLAGIVGDPAASLDDELTRHLNIVTTRMLTDQAKALGIPRFVFASSCSVYGSAEKTVDENSHLNPVSLYAQTKIDSEKEIIQDINDLFHPTILRFSTVFGHSQRMRFDLVANLFTAQAYINGKITVKGSQQWRPMIHVTDIARAIVLTMEAPLTKVSRQIFNVGDDTLNTTIKQMAETAATVIKKSKSGRRVKISVDDSIDDPRNYHVSFEKIKKTLGFEAKTTLTEGMSEIYQHLKEGDYDKPYTDPLYSNLEVTKLIQKEFHSDAYRKTHFSLLSK